ncbi:MAG: hypothetical protein ABFR95_03675 [Actinomycetota bacterium]
MTDLRFDHLYRETHHWDDSVAFWKTLGFSFTQQWGETPHRAGSLRSSDVTIVLAEVDSTTRLGESTFISTTDLEQIGNDLGTTPAETHWGTMMVTATDPDGRVYNFETKESG